jgi:flavin reductase (DIM6/NTAB) family NADH-FMN oxidoreductase RutF
MNNFTQTPVIEIEGNAFKMIGSDWMLVTGGDISSWNTMTAAWGGFGFLWQKNVVFSFVRPTRYTYEFMERADTFTLSFFSEEYRDALNYCGSHSGRDVDKAKETGLVPFDAGSGSVGFQQARLIIVSRKIYHQDINPGRFLDQGISEYYPQKDYHRMYIGEVVQCLRKK